LSERLELSVVAPCRNEEGNLPELVERLRRTFARRGIRGEIVPVDDGSTDGSRALLERLALSDPAVRPVFHDENRGIAAAWKSGLAVARGTYVCLIDADLQYQPEDVGRLLEEIRFSRADVVQGWRSEIGRTVDPRYYYSRALNVLLNLLFRMRSRDNKSGFVLARREVLEDVLRHRLRYRYFQTFIAVAAHRKGYTIREVEVTFRKRLLGRSFISSFPLRVIGGVLADLPKACLEYGFFEQRNTLEQEFLASHPPSREDEPWPRWRRLAYGAWVAALPLHHWNIGWWAAVHQRSLKRTQWRSCASCRS
jgi:phenylacetate-CoA ligase